MRRKYLRDGMSQNPEGVVWGTAMDHISGDRPLKEKKTSKDVGKILDPAVLEADSSLP